MLPAAALPLFCFAAFLTHECHLLHQHGLQRLGESN
jgi:hypothetical protein